MRKIIVIFAMSALMLSSCTEKCDTSKCKFAIGEDVKIKHKPSHDEATVT